MVIFRFVTGSRDAAFCGLVNTFLVTRKPLRSKGSGSAMAAFLEVVRTQNEKEEAKNGRMSGATSNRQAGRKVQENRTRIAMRVQEDLGSFAEFEFEKIMTRTYASTRLRLYPHPDVQSRLLRPSIMHCSDGGSDRHS